MSKLINNVKKEGEDGPVSLELGTEICDYIVGHKLGQGAFGEIYCVYDRIANTIWAMKTESALLQSRFLAKEYFVLQNLQELPYFPRLGVLGNGPDYTFLTMEMHGPSLSHVLREIEGNKFSLSTGLRASYHMLKCIESLHCCGFIHRDIKPGNVLVNDNPKYPLILIDFGLARQYTCQNALHEQKGPDSGFKGTRIYASIRAHHGEDLSRRDDMVSWFYSMYELVVDKLPWRKAQDNVTALKAKEEFDPLPGIRNVCPDLCCIWENIEKLDYQDEPNYMMYYKTIANVCKKFNYTLNDPYDWKDILLAYNKQRESFISSKDQIKGPYHPGSIRKITFKTGKTNSQSMSSSEKNKEKHCLI